jgi:hypothetical protein
MGKIINLTPDLFREFDKLARTRAGCPLIVFDQREQEDFAFFSFQPLVLLR